VGLFIAYEDQAAKFSEGTGNMRESECHRESDGVWAWQRLAHGKRGDRNVATETART